MKFLFISAAICGLLPFRSLAADPFAENVRTTNPLPPEEQAKTFQLPPEFKIELVASEPDIHKPMNIAFDARGRLWVSSSLEYPYPAPTNRPARDEIKILEDFDSHGRARKITTFVDGLNIPMGLYPYKNGVIAWSIPNIWFFQDTNGDGKCDKREILFGPFGWERDTHGNQASFRRGFDGWLYATHGYNNISRVRARDGSEINMHSGNTYRMATDGSHIESYTRGQVNPFGLAFDGNGNLYSADCHSQPIFELLRGAYYPSFGKPHDGLGFGPDVMDHAHGSTAIGGIVVYEDNLWPAEYERAVFTGDVMSSRLDRDTLVAHGSSRKAKHEPAFLTTTDPWFRPNDSTLGPDGAIYVTDFYNRIIGHYEVPLTHPGRDRERGRLWKISYTGKPLHPLPDFNHRSVKDLIAEFRSPNLPRRLLAMNELVDRIGVDAGDALEATVKNRNASPTEIIHSLWALHRLNLDDSQSLRKMSSHSDRDVRTHVMRILAETPDLGSLRQTFGVQALKDSDPFVQRAAADALGQHPEPEVYIRPLLNLLGRVPAEDDHLRHTVRMALRNQLQEGGSMLNIKRYKPEEAREIASVCLGVSHPEAADFLLDYLQNANETGSKITEFVRHTARYVPTEKVSNLASFIREKYKGDPELQLAFFKAVEEGSAQRGVPLAAELRTWGSELAAKLFDLIQYEKLPWRNDPLPGKRFVTNPWIVQPRASSDGDTTALFLSSLPPGGEQFTGRLQSPAFSIPATLKFFLAGHDGHPENAPQGKNFIRLVSDDGRELAKATPPLDNTARPVEWDLSSNAGQQGHLEVVDGDEGTGFAWIAVGRFDPPIVNLPKISPNQFTIWAKAGADITRSLQLTSLAPRLSELLVDERTEMEAQSALAGALVALNPNDQRLALAPLLADNGVPAQLREKVARTISTRRETDSNEVLQEAMRSLPARIQLKLAQSLASSVSGTEALFGIIQKRDASPYLLLDRTIQDKISALNNSTLRSKHAELVHDLEPANDAVQKQIENLRVKFGATKGSATDGVGIFTQNCAICHQIQGKGAVVGPQLDGIGSRGLERLLEDILDPNRNVDINFRTQIVVLKDGDVVSGLLRREEGEVLILADSTGKEISIPKADIQSRRESETSLMPSNFGDIIKEDDFRNLMMYLLSEGSQGSRGEGQ